MDDDLLRATPELEIALLHRGVDERTADSERCGCCHRTPLIGERVYFDAQGDMFCALCRDGQGGAQLGSRVVHGPAFGNTIRITDRRAA